MLSVTPAHALQTENGAWIAAGQLEKGTSLRSISGVVCLDSTFTESVSPTAVISYELEGGLDYMVGEMPVVVAEICHLKGVVEAYGNNKAAFKSFIKDLSETQKNSLIKRISEIQPLAKREQFIANIVADIDNNKAAWKLLHEGGATNLLTEIDAINKAKSLKNAGLSEAQIKIIAQSNDIKGLEIADNLVKNALVTNKAVLHLVIKNAKSLENARPNIMSEIKALSNSR